MASTVISCVICCERYDDWARKPLLLPCNHSFCQNCLQTLENTGRKGCPLCKQGWERRRVSNLPVLYQLIPSETSEHGNTHDETCGPHGDKATFWCESCFVPICNTCLDEMHKTCNFMVIQKYRGREEYQQALNDLVKNMTQNSERVLIFEGFDREVKGQKEKHLTWEKKSQKIYQKFKDICEERPDELKNCESHKTRKQAKEGYEKLNEDVPTDTLLFHVAAAYQKTSDLNIEVFIENLRHSAGVVPDDCCSQLPAARAAQENNIPHFGDGEVWKVSDTTAGSKATRVLCGTDARPSRLIVNGVHWTHDELVILLLEISAVQCEVRVKFLDIFWSPGRGSVEETLSRLQTLLNPGHQCTVTQFWGHLTEGGVKKLPNTIQSVGLILKGADDLKALKALFGVALASPFLKPGTKIWTDLSELNLCFAKSYSDENGMLWNADARKLIANCTFLNINFGLHFPSLNSADLVWMKGVFLKILPESSHQQRVKNIYLPGTSLAADDFLNVLRDCGLRCQVHLPNHQLKDSDAVESYSAIGCSVSWDLEAIFPTKHTCSIM